MEPRVFLEENAVEGMKGDTVVEEDIYSILMKKKRISIYCFDLTEIEFSKMSKLFMFL